MGRSHGGFPDFGYLDPYSSQAPYQLSGAQGRSLCPTALGPSAPGPPGYDRYRQFNSSLICISPALLRLTVKLLLWLEAQNIIVRARHIPGRLIVVADHLSHPNRPIPTEWSLHPEIVNRIFGFWGTPAGGRSNSHSPLVAETVVVSTPTSSLCGSPPVLSLPSRSSVPAGSEVCLGRKVVPSARMEALVRHYKAAGFSDEVSRLTAAPRRPSTKLMYDDQWLRFARWAAAQGFDPLDPTAAQVASFLFTLFDTHGLSLQTVKGYRTCLGSVLNRTGKAKVVMHKTISDMIASMELQRPRVTPVLPQWDLGIVLEALSKPPYEPLREASFKHLTLKTVFLLAMASAGRRSELQALRFDQN